MNVIIDEPVRQRIKEVDEKLFKELARLTKAGAAKFSEEKFIDGIRERQGS